MAGIIEVMWILQLIDTATASLINRFRVTQPNAKLTQEINKLDREISKLNLTKEEIMNDISLKQSLISTLSPVSKEFSMYRDDLRNRTNELKHTNQSIENKQKEMTAKSNEMTNNQSKQITSTLDLIGEAAETVQDKIGGIPPTKLKRRD